MGQKSPKLDILHFTICLIDSSTIVYNQGAIYTQQKCITPVCHTQKKDSLLAFWQIEPLATINTAEPKSNERRQRIKTKTLAIANALSIVLLKAY